MSITTEITRRRFLAGGSVGAFALGLSGCRVFTEAAFPRLKVPEEVFLRRWEVDTTVLYDRSPAKEDRKRAIRIVGTNGAEGFVPFWISRGSVSGGRPGVWASEGGLSAQTVAVLSSTNVLDHERVHDRLTAAGVPEPQVAAADLACWDLHARMLALPLHALLGTRRTRALRYGDVRGEAAGFEPQAYADRVARHLTEQSLQATKLHFPGAMGTHESIRCEPVKDTLRRIRATAGPGAMLAYDPYPGTAESATASMDEAAELLRVLNELGYAWVEGPLTPEPESTQLQRYVQLMKGPRVRIQPEGSGRIGDLTDFATIKRWATAGAADQFSTDCYYRDGITPIVRLLAWVRARPRLNLTINLHWSWLPHVHLAMACDDAEYPCVEVPAAAEYPSALYAGSPFVRAPDWPGIYLLRAAAPA